MNTEPKNRSKTPATIAVGLALTLLCVLGLIAGGEVTAIGIAVFVVGVLLLCTGAIQMSIERSRR